MPLYGTVVLSSLQRLAMPTGAIGEAGIGRFTGIASTSVLNSGVLRVGAMQMLPAGATVTNIVVAGGTVAAISPTNQWFSIIRVSDRSVLAKTVDDTTTAWGASTNKSLALSAPFTPTADELVYIGLVVAAGTVPTLMGWTIPASVTAIAPVTCGNSTSGLTDPASLGATAGAITAGQVSFYAYTT